MSKIINLSDFKNQKKERKQLELTELIKQASMIKKSVTSTAKDSNGKDICCISKKDAENLFYSKIIEQLQKKSLLSSITLGCSLYISNSLTRLITEEPACWVAFDYLEKYTKDNNPIALKQGGDMCFFIVSIFSEKITRRSVSVRYYENMGISFYYLYYSNTKIEIYYYMSEIFRLMSSVTKQSLDNLKNI